MIFNCFQCGKEVERMFMDEYLYKKKHQDRTIYFCGWNCMRKFEKEKEVKKRENRT